MSDNYGQCPIELGKYKLDVKEMMYYLYLPISIPGMNSHKVEDRLQVFLPLIERVRSDLGRADFIDNYIYLTAKRLFVTPSNPGNRPGWHSDGFMTDDINYIWCDNIPTVFNASQFGNITQDHQQSLLEFESRRNPSLDFVYPVNILLKLNQFVIHNSPTDFAPQMRTFVKISVSSERYNLIGNSINELNRHWEMFDRKKVRNCPQYSEYQNSDFVKI